MTKGRSVLALAPQLKISKMCHRISRWASTPGEGGGQRPALDRELDGPGGNLSRHSLLGRWRLVRWSVPIEIGSMKQQAHGRSELGERDLYAREGGKRGGLPSQGLIMGRAKEVPHKLIRICFRYVDEMSVRHKEDCQILLPENRIIYSAGLIHALGHDRGNYRQGYPFCPLNIECPLQGRPTKIQRGKRYRCLGYGEGKANSWRAKITFQFLTLAIKSLLLIIVPYIDLLPPSTN